MRNVAEELWVFKKGEAGMKRFLGRCEGVEPLKT
jgi:hypothetical protein